MELIVIFSLLAAVVACAASFHFWRTRATSAARVVELEAQLQSESEHRLENDEANATRTSELEKQLQSEQQQHAVAAATNQTRISELEKQLQKESEQRAAEAESHEEFRQKREGEAATHAAEIAELRQQLKDSEERVVEKIALLEDVRESMTAQFKNVAQGILDDKAKKFGEDSHQLLSPLKDQLKEFQRRTDEIHDINGRDQASLKTEIQNLHDNAAKIGSDANNLTAALKGDNKTQGNWGEVQLAALLEKSGLREGEAYETQKSMQDEDGNWLRPDVVINLPHDRHFIVDSKISLLAYADHVAATDEDEKKTLLASHVASIRRHVKGLTDKKYSTLRGVNTPDLVFMFMAVEPALWEAFVADPNLFNDAHQKGVVICSPTTLMPILSIANQLWRLDRQNRNAQEIAQQGGALYDKFHGFVESMNAIDKALEKARESYDAAFGKLSKGRGNLTRQAEKLRDMGIPTKKDKLLPSEPIVLVESVVEEAESS